jgi:hypothetical protein
MEVAKTILSQLGGKRFIMMTGSSNFIQLDNGLGMKLKRNTSKANYLRIKLTSMDDYLVEFVKITAKDMKVVKTYEGVYCDQLEDIFTDATGLYTRF